MDVGNSIIRRLIQQSPAQVVHMVARLQRAVMGSHIHVNDLASLTDLLGERFRSVNKIEIASVRLSRTEWARLSGAVVALQHSLIHEFEDTGGVA